MAEYNLPELKEEGEEKCMTESVPYDEETESRWYRTVRIPANKAVIDSLTVGGNAVVTLKGKITSLESRETEKGKGRQEFEIELMAVKTDAENEFSELVEDD